MRPAHGQIQIFLSLPVLCASVVKIALRPLRPLVTSAFLPVLAGELGKLVRFLV